MTNEDAKRAVLELEEYEKRAMLTAVRRYNIVAALADAIRTHPEGWTMNARGTVYPKRGYSVGIEDLHSMQGAALVLENGGTVGGWTDVADGKFYLDRVLIVTDKAEALALARQHGQKAIWGFAEGQEFAVEPVEMFDPCEECGKIAHEAWCPVEEEG